MENCIFCKIAQKEAQATIELETDNVIAFRNIEPVADTHILIIPKTHTATFLDLEPGVMADMAKVAHDLIAKNSLQGAYKLAFNGGKYQKVPHVHWHLLGGEMHDKSDILNQT